MEVRRRKESLPLEALECCCAAQLWEYDRDIPRAPRRMMSADNALWCCGFCYDQVCANESALGQQRFYFNRIAGGDRNYCDPGRHVIARAGQSQDEGLRHWMR